MFSSEQKHVNRVGANTFLQKIEKLSELVVGFDEQDKICNYKNNQAPNFKFMAQSQWLCLATKIFIR